jgi:S-adenosylmethionine synthetase
MVISIERLDSAPTDLQPVEIVERKGRGHPDTICDALAEELSLGLSRFYQDRFGAILHHNVDKVLLRGGASRPAFGGGEVLEPIEIYLGGRASSRVGDVMVPVEAIAIEGSRRWLSENLHALDAPRHVVIRSLVRPGSADLVDLFGRQDGALANDTSCGVGFAPLSDLERVVLAVERELSTAAVRHARPEIGEDVKVMGIRRGDRIHLTVACAFVDRFVADMPDYVKKRADVAELAVRAARGVTRRSVDVEVNTADDPSRESVYLTVTGSSAEAGDDGEAGRGNRVNGLITPSRPMTMESVAGKNPVTHVGKLYNLVAGLIAEEVADAMPELAEVRCTLVSQIGRPVAEPRIVDVRVRGREARPVEDLWPGIEAVVRGELARIDSLARDLIRGDLRLDRWPLRS